MELTAENVMAVGRDCMFERDEVDQDGNPKPGLEMVVAEGITVDVGFCKARLEAHRADIESMLLQLPDEFTQSKGGGWTFLNACNTKTGEQWTGLHKTMELLFLLGIAIGKVKWALPRTMWSAFPGGMPYVVVLDGAPPAAREMEEKDSL